MGLFCTANALSLTLLSEEKRILAAPEDVAGVRCLLDFLSALIPVSFSITQEADITRAMRAITFMICFTDIIQQLLASSSITSCREAHET